LFTIQVVAFLRHSVVLGLLAVWLFYRQFGNLVNLRLLQVEAHEWLFVALLPGCLSSMSSD